MLLALSSHLKRHSPAMIYARIVQVLYQSYGYHNNGRRELLPSMRAMDDRSFPWVYYVWCRVAPKGTEVKKKITIDYAIVQSISVLPSTVLTSWITYNRSMIFIRTSLSLLSCSYNCCMRWS